MNYPEYIKYIIYFLYICYDYFDDFLNPFNIRHFELLLCMKCGA